MAKEYCPRKTTDKWVITSFTHIERCEGEYATQAEAKEAMTSFRNRANENTVYCLKKRRQFQSEYRHCTAKH